MPQVLVCNPDRPVGRKKIISPPPTKLLAKKFGITVWQPEDLKSWNWESEVGKIKPDFAIVAAYSKILPREIIELFPLGMIGVHPSLLPKYRGPSPIQSFILSGETETGTTLFLIDEKMDNGPIIAQKKLRLRNNEIERINYEELNQKLAELSGDLLVEILPHFSQGKIKPKPQDASQATSTKKFKIEDAYVDLADLTKAENIGGNLAMEIWRKIRALNPEPGVWTLQEIQGKQKRIKLLEAEIIEGKLKLRKIQQEGKKPTFLK